MLHVEEAARRRGIASALVARAEDELEAAGEPAVAYIVDENTVSEHCFASRGWRRAVDADWVGFERSAAAGRESVTSRLLTA